MVTDMTSQVPLKYSPTIELLGDSFSTLLNVTCFGKTYTNGYPLNGKKKTDSKRITNGYQKRLNGFPDRSNG